MNEIVNKFLLAGGKFMPEMHLRQPTITQSTCGLSSTKNKERIKKLKKQEIHNIFIKTSQIKLVFNMTWRCGDVKDLARRTSSDKILCDMALLKIRNMMDMKEVLLQWSINFPIKNFWQPY